MLETHHVPLGLYEACREGPEVRKREGKSKRIISRKEEKKKLII